MTDADELDKIKPFLTHVIKNVKILYQDRTYSDELNQINYIESKLPDLIEDAKKKIIERESEKIRIALEAQNKLTEQENEKICMELEAQNKLTEQKKTIRDLISNIETELNKWSPDLKNLIQWNKE
jgi:hypothetical protein